MTLSAPQRPAIGVWRQYRMKSSTVSVLTDPNLRARVDHLARLVAAAFLQEYREIFTVAAAMCVLAALVIVATIPQRLRATAIK